MASTISPVFTLRGHDSGVTSLHSLEDPDGQYLVSGDENGDIRIWSTMLFKCLSHVHKVCLSRVQSIHAVLLDIKCQGENLLVVQSRDDGIYILKFKDALQHNEATVIEHYSSYPSLFSRGCARAIDRHGAILAYPSESSGHVITVRLVSDDAKTIATTQARRSSESHNLFDVIIRKHDHEYSIYAAYEDGSIGHYSLDIFDLDDHSDRLKVNLLRTIDIGSKDFVSAFDVSLEHLVGGSTNKTMTIYENLATEDCKLVKVPTKRRGISAISILTDRKCVAIACWDRSVNLYSLATKTLQATMSVHGKHVESILFIRTKTLEGMSDMKGTYTMFCASLDGTISASTLE